MALQLEVEFLSGLYFGSFGPESTEADWPPQPDRVFSALVASWAGRGQQADEAKALEWLEALEPPTIHAARAAQRSAAQVFVPPNDPTSRTSAGVQALLPTSRRRQPRRFPAARPEDSTLRLLWMGAEVEKATLECLNRVAADAAYLGHSSSLARFRFRSVEHGTRHDGGESARRTVYPGRLAELCRRFDTGQRPLAGAPVNPRAPETLQPRGVFGTRWLILEHIGGTMPDVRAAPLVARAIRDTIMSGYARSGLGDRVPEVVSGHNPDGTPTEDVHISVVPLPFTGFPHADGHVLGFAVIPPQESDILDDPDFLGALRRLAPIDPATGRRTIAVQSRRGATPTSAFSIDLAPTFEVPENRWSLDPRPYLAPSASWATVTPIALDRHLKGRGEGRRREMIELIEVACERIGLPRPVEVAADKHAALKGMPSAYPSGKAPEWTGWRLPRFLRSRPLVHAVLRFDEPVEGPILLGAGRFTGLGLCRAVRGGDD